MDINEYSSTNIDKWDKRLRSREALIDTLSILLIVTLGLCDVALHL